jgi:hypothetical protein
MTERETCEAMGWAASRLFARYWLAECRRIEEEIHDPAARWAIMVAALARIGQRPDPPA